MMETVLNKLLWHYPWIVISLVALLVIIFFSISGRYKSLEAFWENPYVAAAFRVFLGISFIAASMTKIPHPAEFSENVAGFMMVPFWGVNLMGLIMPWSELVAGLFLILGIRTRAAATIIGLLLLVFIVGLTINLIKGTPINCGCFESVGEPINWDLVVRDTVMLIMVFQIFFHDRLFVFDRGGFIWRERKI
jgi:putative oxidoreductase